MLRVEFTDTDSSNSYSVPYNPVSIDLLQNVNRDVVSNYSGLPLIRTATIDNRVRSMQWGSYASSNSSFETMVRELKSYVGRNKIVNFQDFDYNSLGTQTIQILNVRKVILNDFKGLRYSLVIDFIFKNAIITEITPPVSETTDVQLKTAYLDAGSAWSLWMASKVSGYSENDRVEPVIDVAGNAVTHNLADLGTNTHSQYKATSGPNSKPALYFPTSETSSYIVDNQGVAREHVDFLVERKTDGFTIISLLNMTEENHAATDLKIILDNTNLNQVNPLDGYGCFWKDANHGVNPSGHAFFCGRDGSGTADWYWGNGFELNWSATNFWQADTWILLIQRVDWSAGGAVGQATNKVYNGLGSSYTATNNRVIHEFGTASIPHSLIFGGPTTTSPYFNQGEIYFSGYFCDFVIYDEPISDANLNTLLTTINSFYSTSFSLT